MIADIIREHDEAIRALVISPSWVVARHNPTSTETYEEATATLEIRWLLGLFSSPSAFEDGVTYSGGRMTYTRTLDLGDSYRAIEDLERDILESAWLVGAPDCVRTEEADETRWGFYAGGVRDLWRKPRRIDPVGLQGPGNRLEIEMRGGEDS